VSDVTISTSHLCFSLCLVLNSCFFLFVHFRLPHLLLVFFFFPFQPLIQASAKRNKAEKKALKREAEERLERLQAEARESEAQMVAAMEAEVQKVLAEKEAEFDGARASDAKVKKHEPVYVYAYMYITTVLYCGIEKCE